MTESRPLSYYKARFERWVRQEWRKFETKEWSDAVDIKWGPSTGPLPERIEALWYPTGPAPGCDTISVNRNWAAYMSGVSDGRVAYLAENVGAKGMDDKKPTVTLKSRAGYELIDAAEAVLHAFEDSDAEQWPWARAVLRHLERMTNEAINAGCRSP